MNKNIPWEELGLSNDFIFAKVMRNPDLCKKLIELILGIKVDHIEFPEEQKVIDITRDAKSVRLDVYVADENHTVYNIEMQTTSDGHIPERSRYYQGMIDLNAIEKGKPYRDLPTSYVIFICTFDPFGEGRCKYEFENREVNTSKPLNDGTHKVFLNATGTSDDVSPECKSFLRFVESNTNDGDNFVSELDEAVRRAKFNEEWRVEYMTLYMRDQEKKEEGCLEGLQEGRKEGRKEGIAFMAQSLYSAGTDIPTIAKLAAVGEDKIREWLGLTHA